MKFKMSCTSLGSDTEAVASNNGKETWGFITTMLFNLELLSSELLRKEQRQFLTDVSGQLIGPILKK